MSAGAALDEAGRAARVARLLAPRSIAIVGVSPDPGSIGGAVLANLEKFGYPGEIHLVTRRQTEIGGRPCVPTVDDLPQGIDVAVLAVPQAIAAEAVAACGRRNVGAAVVYAAGFAETGDEGKAAQTRLVEAARAGNVALFGPNCIGIVNFVGRAPLTYEPHVTQEMGKVPAIGLAAQSGAMASTLRLALQGKGLVISWFISTGNEADLHVEDFLPTLIADDNTRVIVVYAEQLRAPARFLALAADARAASKPIVLLHPGRSARAQATMLSHTGALAPDHAVMAALVAREAVVRVDTIEEAIDTAELLARFPTPPTKGAGIVTNSGAFKGIAADMADAVGLDLPAPAPATIETVKRALPPYATVENPLDVTGQSVKDPGILGAAARGLLDDPAIGSLIVSIISGNGPMAMDKGNVLLPEVKGSTKPVALCAFGDESPLPAEFVSMFRDNNIVFLRSPERAIRATAHATTYGRALEAAARRAPGADLPEIVLPVGTVPEYLGKKAAAALGIAVPEGGLARDLAEAKSIAKRIGYPVALKAQAGALAHKSDAGGVILGLATEATLGNGWVKLQANLRETRPNLELDGVLVERMARAGLELVVGARRDPAWGPVAMVGLGGIWIEALKDVRLMACDLTEDQIVDELTRLRGAALLQGIRGTPPADVEAVAAIVARVGALMRARPDISEVDINPLFVYPKGQGALALDVLIVTGERDANEHPPGPTAR